MYSATFKLASIVWFTDNRFNKEFAIKQNEKDCANGESRYLSLVLGAYCCCNNDMDYSDCIRHLGFSFFEAH
jgi:hypothetical protein